MNCTVWLISLLVIGSADLSFLRDCCLLEGGSGGERRKEDPHQARPQGLLVFQYGSRRHIGKRKDPGARLHPSTRRNKKDPNFIFGLASQL